MPGSAFHYVEFGTWEFPFIAETNCKNFSLLHLDGASRIDPNVWRKAKEIESQRNRIAEIGRRYSYHWLAFDRNNRARFTDERFRRDGIWYPNNLSASDFFEEASLLRVDFFKLKSEVGALTEHIKRRWNIHDSRLESWLELTSKQMGILTRQIDELESKKQSSPFKLISRWALHDVTGRLAWEGLKWTKDIIAQILKTKPLCTESAEVALRTESPVIP